jgi:D-glycero-D-manno-heptose 1,7-bisphosphate phosphatase
MKRAVFLDRDGVINRAFVVDGQPLPARTLHQLEILPGVRGAIEKLRFSDFEIVVVTNQPDVARGVLTKGIVESIHARLSFELHIDHFYTCFHDTADNCQCRKPNPGLLLNASKDLHLDLTQSFLVGDRWRDIAAGQAAGCNCLFIDYSYDEKQPEMPYLKVSSLSEAARIILEEKNDNVGE